VIAAWELPELFEVFPTRQKIEAEDNPLFPFPDRLSSVFSALGEKANS